VPPVSLEAAAVAMKHLAHPLLLWSDWNIVAKSDPSRKNPDAVEHSALIYGISGSGEITTLYPSNFKPSEIVHDVPLLAAA
jgi:hypothetical protein